MVRELPRRSFGKSCRDLTRPPRDLEVRPGEVKQATAARAVEDSPALNLDAPGRLEVGPFIFLGVERRKEGDRKHIVRYLAESHSPGRTYLPWRRGPLA
jgi:hypothetical protein